MVDGLTRVRLPRGQVVDARDVAVGDEPALLLLQPVDEIEGGLRRLAGVARVGVNAVDLEQRGHRRVREAVHAGHRLGGSRLAARLRPLRRGGLASACFEPAVVLPQAARRVAAQLDPGTQLDRPLEDAHVQLPLSGRRQIVELPHQRRLHVRSHEDDRGARGLTREPRSTTPPARARAGRRAGARGSRG